MSSLQFKHSFDFPLYRGSVTVNTGLFIDNEWVDPVCYETTEVINPASEKVITKVCVGSPPDVDKAVRAARKAFETTWGLNTPGPIRRELINKLADLIERDADMIAAVESLENGCPFLMSRGYSVVHVVKCLRYYAGLAAKIAGRTIETNASKFAYTRQEPIGVCALIIPWNLPLIMMAWKIAPALASGCSVVFKPSENTPLSALMVCQLIKEAGFPAGVFNLINGYGNVVGEALSLHPDVDKIAFTGSNLVGRKVIRAAADSNLKRVTVELGGKSPIVILDDSDVQQAARWSAFGAFANAGQVCTAGSRILVQESIYEQFLDAFMNVVRNTKLGDPFDDRTTQGPQISKAHFDRIMSYINSGKESGATCALGGQRHGDTGYFIQPTIFTNAKPGMKIVKEEIFGPVVVIMKFKSDEEAVDMANDSVLGLACGVFSQDINRALNVVHSLEAGSVFVNCYNSIDVELPFGGYRQSGWGRELGEDAIQNFMKVKSVHINLGYKQ